MHADTTAVTMQCNTIVLNEVRQLNAPRATIRKKHNKLFGQLNIAGGQSRFTIVCMEKYITQE